MEDRAKNRKLAIIALIGLTTAIILVWLISLFLNAPKTEEVDYGPRVEIADLKKQVPSISDNYAKNLEADLYKALSKNNSSVNAETTKAQIRSGSIESENNADERSYYYSFIVDIDSLKQSYRVQLNWSLDDDGNVVPYGYPIIVTCLFSIDERIYDDFACVDDFKETNL